MELVTPHKHKLLKYRYYGMSVNVGSVLYKPIIITRFEIVKSQRNKGKYMLVMQLKYVQDDIIKTVPVFTESYTLVSTIRDTEKDLPHYTKIIRKRDGYYYFVSLNYMEKETLKKIKL
jgi:hypothetical protein